MTREERCPRESGAQPLSTRPTNIVAPDGVIHYTTPSGSPLRAAEVGTDGGLTPGEVTVMVVQIETARGRLPRYRTRVLAGSGAR